MPSPRITLLIILFIVWLAELYFTKNISKTISQSQIQNSASIPGIRNYKPNYWKIHILTNLFDRAKYTKNWNTKLKTM